VATETTLDVRLGGKVLRQKTKINFGGAGLPLSELSNVCCHAAWNLRTCPYPAEDRVQ
jgi:hypothetical protein